MFVSTCTVPCYTLPFPSGESVSVTGSLSCDFSFVILGLWPVESGKEREVCGQEELAGVVCEGE